MFTSEQIIFDCPAYTLGTMPIWRQAKTYHGLEFALPFQSRSHGTQYHFFKLGSVFGYAAENGDDPLASYERAKKHGHNVRWANAQAVVITAWKQEKRSVYALNWGDVIGFEGTRYKLVKAPNDNVSLVEVFD